MPHPASGPQAHYRRTTVTDTVHQAVLYRTPAELAVQLARHLRTAIGAGELVVAVLDEPNRSALRDALGDAAAAVEFPEPARVHQVPAFTVAVRWARLARRTSSRGGRLTVVNQHVDGPVETDREHWARVDMALDIATAGLPITVLCPHREDGPDLGIVHATHRSLVTTAGVRPSTGYRPPREAIVHFPPPPPPELGPPDVELSFAAANLPRLRRDVAGCAESAGLRTEQIPDVVLAVNEIVTNSVEHGPGHGSLRMWARPSRLVCEVTDPGRMDVPFPGLAAPAPRGDRGRGLWLASELSEILQVWSDDGGTVVRLHHGGRTLSDAPVRGRA